MQSQAQAQAQVLNLNLNLKLKLKLSISQTCNLEVKWEGGRRGLKYVKNGFRSGKRALPIMSDVYIETPPKARYYVQNMWK
jgi:hypothetical protein